MGEENVVVLETEKERHGATGQDNSELKEKHLIVVRKRGK